ncbi:aminopeptidase N [Pseudidiomarina sp. WS423]|uniref:aminopeptidase N n=1 Tax=Pseudidiomarina sp. WS423 TaxID=3425124 RepID=UPI003D6ED389
MSEKQAKFRSDYRAPDFSISTVELTFYLDPHHTRVHNRMQVHPQRQQQPLCLDGEQLKLLEVSINGELLDANDYQLDAQQLVLTKVPEQAFELEVVTEIDPANNTALEGLYQTNGSFCTQCEAEGFRRITYYLDRPDVLAIFTTTIYADQQQYPYLLSNGNPQASGTTAAGQQWVTWHDPFPKPAYLFALVAGNFELLEDHFTTRSGKQVLLQLFVDPGNLARAHYAMQALKNSMAWDEQRFGLEYDLDIYMIVAVDFFNMGAMENKGLNVFNSRYVLADAATATDQDFLNVESVIGHEYFHNWTGNRITCRDWFQLSLKEGLTVFRDQEFSSDLGSRAVNRIQAIRVMRSHQFNEDASPMAHPIRPDKVIEMNNFYTVTVYNKGAEVIRMLHTLLGEAGFQAGMRCYIERHDGQAVTCDDFIAAMAAANQCDLTRFKNWYSQAGTPVVRVTENYTPASAQTAGQLRLRFAQHTPATPGQTAKQPVHIPVLLSAYSSRGERLELTHPELQLHESGSYLFELTEATAEVTITGLHERPILALLENFSAPVRLEYNQSFADKAVLLGSAEQEVTRWEAAQQMYLDLLTAAVAKDGLVSLPPEVSMALQELLAAPLDPALKALALTPPAAEELAEHYPQDIPLALIGLACEQLKRAIAAALAEQLATWWQQQQGQPYELTAQAIAQRSLTHLAAYYLALNDPEAFNSEISQAFSHADNMTSQQALLQIATHLELACASDLLEQFELRWQHDPLVLDKWFAVQASAPVAGTVARVAELVDHPRFNRNNPNRVYALLATFSRNLLAFHQADGAGYQVVASMVSYLNGKNPQVAARLITPFTQWRRFDKQRQKLLLGHLQELQQLPNLAPDLAEKISSSLAPDMQA